ncbi:MAG: phosphoenolpyruvate--protein phosphotransferase, partial [Clostridia bacterium]|nr:phosphoenolpyruvate--protein phosphotransferase [Clostridia bacterium]
IIIAKDLTPSDTASLKADATAGIITEIGGSTSHSAIIARTLGIPAVMGVKNATALIEDNSIVTIDGQTGKIIANPSEEILEDMREKIRLANEEREALRIYLDQPSHTKDGIEVEISSNIAGPDDLPFVIENGSDGIGLFRSEFIFMNRSEAPSEEEQYAIYKKVLSTLSDKPVIIRTLDAGGDKEIPYLDIPKEMNPFLGYRAIRYCLDHDSLFKAQIRALLRASVYGKLRIMFPMISSLEELLAAKAVVAACKAEMTSEGIPFSEDIELGIMIEIPSAAIISDILAKEVDFFSIGTNDLIQYSVAVDRMNEQIKNLYTPYHPAVIRLIKTVIENGHAAGIWVGMCGAVAGNEKMIPLLLHLGLDEFSMGPTDVLKARKIISQLNRKNETFVQNILAASTSEAVEALLTKE